MNIIYLITGIVSVVSFDGMSKRGKLYQTSDRVWLPLYLVSTILSIIFSGGIESGIITAIILIIGNGLIWGLIWAVLNKFR